MKDRESILVLCQQSEKILVLLSLLCSRLSHYFRSPLGTALGVVRDLRSGLALDEQDYADAEQSLLEILEVLNLLKDMGGAPGLAAEKTAILPLLSDIKVVRKGREVRYQCSSQYVAVSAELDPKLFVRAMRCLLVFLDSHRQNSAYESPVSVMLELDGAEVVSCIKIYWKQKEPASKNFSNSLVDLALADHTVAGIGLLFVQAVVAAHRWDATIGLMEDGNMCLSIELKQGEC